MKITTDVPQEMKDRIDRYLSSEGARASGMIDRAQLIREALNDYLSRKGT